MWTRASVHGLARVRASFMRAHMTTRTHDPISTCNNIGSKWRQCSVRHLGRNFLPLTDTPSDVPKVRPTIYSIMRAPNSHSCDVRCWGTRLWFSRIWKPEPIQWPQTICDFAQVDNTLWTATEPSPQHEKHKVCDSGESQFLSRDTRTLPWISPETTLSLEEHSPVIRQTFKNNRFGEQS